MYVIKTNMIGGRSIVRLEDNAFIPFDPANVDYQEYLVWIEQGNTAEEDVD
jgi:hypothetical protein